MIRGGQKILAIILFIITLLIHFYAGNEQRVETQYSQGVFPVIAGFMRSALGSIPISLGDLLYGILMAWLFYKLYKIARFSFRKQNRAAVKRKLYHNVYKAFIFCSLVYIIFNLLWGINYDRIGIANQLGIKVDKYSKGQLKEINAILVEKINRSKASLTNQNFRYPGNRQMFNMASMAYRNLSARYPFLNYDPASIKPSMWGWIGNYTGFTGYYNPFTGEAQVNTLVPKFTQPYTTCHELAHQIGYAKEMEANFVGYLAAAASTDTLFHYSVYLDLFTYANRNLYYIDSNYAKHFRKQLSEPVEKDIQEWIAFNRRHKNPVGPVVRYMYGLYLRGNRQPQGILAYDEVTAFIIAYYKKFGKI